MICKALRSWFLLFCTWSKQFGLVSKIGLVALLIAINGGLVFSATGNLIKDGCQIRREDGRRIYDICHHVNRIGHFDNDGPNDDYINIILPPGNFHDDDGWVWEKSQISADEYADYKVKELFHLSFKPLKSFPILYGGSTKIKSILLSSILF